MKISILGFGTFGGALAHILEKNNCEVIKEEIGDSEIIFISVPSFAIEEVLLRYKDELLNKKIVICSKGFNKNGELLSSFLEKEFSGNRFYFLYGPTLADGLIKDEYSGFVLAGDDKKEEIKKIIESENVYVELSDDIVGIQVGSTLKNAVTIFVGLVKGADLGENTEAFVYAKGLESIKNVGISLGAKPETFLGLVCAGDLYLTSRSRELGIELGKGKKFEVIDKELIYPKEGIYTLKNLEKIEKFSKADLSYFKLIYDVIFENLSIKDAVKMIK